MKNLRLRKAVNLSLFQESCGWWKSGNGRFMNGLMRACKAVKGIAEAGRGLHVIAAHV